MNAHKLERGNLRQLARLAGTFAALASVGCGAVPASVKSLVEVQTNASNKARSATETWTQSRTQYAANLDAAIAELDKSLQAAQREEAKYALVFASNQNLEGKTRIDAAAAAYLIGKIYLADQEGLSASVREQFTASEAVLEKLAGDLTSSWGKITALQGQIRDYAEKSSIASIDAAFVAALARQVPAASANLDDLLEKSKKLKDVLDHTGAVDQMDGLGAAQTATGDLINLLERVKASRSTP